MKTQKTQREAVDLDRLVRLLRSVWDDVGIPPKDALMAFAAGIIVAIPVMFAVWATAWVLCQLTGKPLDDNAAMASVAVLFLAFCILRAALYVRDKWRESSKANVKDQAQPNVRAKPTEEAARP